MSEIFRQLQPKVICAYIHGQPSAGQHEALLWLANLCHIQHSKGYHFILYGIYKSPIWKNIPYKFFQEHRTHRRCSQCMLGLVHPTTNRPLRSDLRLQSSLSLKRTTFACSERHVHDSLSGLPSFLVTSTQAPRLANTLANDSRQQLETGPLCDVTARSIIAQHSVLTTICLSCPKCRLGRTGE